MKIACLLFVALIVIVNVVAAIRQVWVLLRTKIDVCNGVIVSSLLGQEEEWHGGDNRLTIYRPLVEFEYEAAGRMMRSDRISFAIVKTSKRSEVEKRLRFYQKGKSVKVFYNADDPAEAYLKNPRNHIWTSVFWGLGMTVFGTAFGTMIWKVVP